jgi:hypothetical protein
MGYLLVGFRKGLPILRKTATYGKFFVHLVWHQAFLRLLPVVIQEVIIDIAKVNVALGGCKPS